MTSTSYLAATRTAASGLTASEVARAYNYPTTLTGKGRTCAIIELGGGFGPADLRTYFGTSVPAVTPVVMPGGANTSDGANGADGEVLLDVEVAASVAPGAAFRVYFAVNTDAGFLAAIERATADLQPNDVISISWGGPESSWDPASMDRFNGAFAAARAKGITTFVAAGDSGSRDGTAKPVADFPASSPHVVSCGGTRLTLNSDGSRAAEVTWHDSSTSATGGGVSTHFPGRQVPDVAGNADPVSGYEVVVDGGRYVIGGTSAVAPLYAGLALLLGEAMAGKPFDFLNTVVTNPGVCFDVTVGDNGDYRAGPGRDETTGFGVVDGAKILAVLTDAIPDPAPPTPAPSPTPAPEAGLTLTFKTSTDVEVVKLFAASPHRPHRSSNAAEAIQDGSWS